MDDRQILLLCSLCDKPVELETTKTDDDGQAVHEDCYARMIANRQPGD
jgi:hypothetical protein